MKTKKTVITKAARSLLLILSVYTATLCSCQKYLDAKPDQSIATPSSLSDLKGLLDNYGIMNAHYPSASEVSSDDFYLTTADWASLTDRQRYFYIWQKFDDIGGDYSSSYNGIETSNIILSTLPQISSNDIAGINLVKGGALFTRAAYHFALAQLFASAYDPLTADADPGIVLRQTSDLAVTPVRVSLRETYASIIADLQQSIPLLPSAPDIKYHPSMPAAFGLLSRVYLSMRDYGNAGRYADSCLMHYSKLMDYNTISTTAAIPFSQFNDEVIYDARSSPPPALSQSRAKMDTTLYLSYDGNDLRKAIYFKSVSGGSHAFKGNYTGLGNASLFTGIATDEVMLTAAECAARNNNSTLALGYLNQLLTARWKRGTFIPYTTTDPKTLLAVIVAERRKELLFRSLRWIDLRRLNFDPVFAHNIYRNINGTLYTLAPLSDRYVFEIDRNAVNISGILQNP